MTPRRSAWWRLGVVAGLLAASGCAGRSDLDGGPRGRPVCVDPRRAPASMIRPGDRAIDLHWCGTPPYPERGSWLKASATLDDIVTEGFPKLGYGLVLGDAATVDPERDFGGWIRTMVRVRLVDAVSVLGPGTGPKGAGLLPFAFEDGVVRIDGVTVRTPHHERAAVTPGRRYLFTYAQDMAIQNPWAGPVWAVDARGRIVAAVGGTKMRPWMRALIGHDAVAVLDRLARRAGATRYPGSVLP
jgi:hypothetical protein